MSLDKQSDLLTTILEKDELTLIKEQNLIDNAKELSINRLSEDIFIYINDNSISKELCDEMVEKFQQDNKKARGMFGRGRIDLNYKYTDDLYISTLKHWEHYDKILNEILKNEIYNYINRLCSNNSYAFSALYNNILFDDGFQIQRYTKLNGHYIWHTDDMIISEEKTRYLAFIWYLNDVDEGGETMFLNGYVKPKAGKLLIFPATWTYLHKGSIPKSNDKYIITGCLSRVI